MPDTIFNSKWKLSFASLSSRNRARKYLLEKYRDDRVSLWGPWTVIGDDEAVWSGGMFCLKHEEDFIFMSLLT